MAGTSGMYGGGKRMQGLVENFKERGNYEDRGKLEDNIRMYI